MALTEQQIKERNAQHDQNELEKLRLLLAKQGENKNPLAYKILCYQDDKDPNFKEMIWNSRDGVTPYMVLGKGEEPRRLYHSRLGDTMPMPFYTPSIGERVFVDMTPERALQCSRVYLTNIKEAAEGGNLGAQGMFLDIEQDCIEDILYVQHHPEGFTPEQLSDPFYPFTAWLKKHSQNYLQGEPDLIEVDEKFLVLLAQRRLSEKRPEVLFNGPITIRALVLKALDNSKKKGFFPLNAQGEIASVNVTEKLCMIHSEITEALEEYRSRESEDLTHRYTDEKGKPCGFGSELADAMIRIAGLAGALKIDLELEIRDKMEYNLTRPYQHGKKYGER